GVLLRISPPGSIRPDREGPGPRLGGGRPCGVGRPSSPPPIGRAPFGLWACGRSHTVLSALQGTGPIECSPAAACDAARVGPAPRASRRTEGAPACEPRQLNTIRVRVRSCARVARGFRLLVAPVTDAAANTAS